MSGMLDHLRERVRGLEGCDPCVEDGCMEGDAMCEGCRNVSPDAMRRHISEHEAQAAEIERLRAALGEHNAARESITLQAAGMIELAQEIIRTAVAAEATPGQGDRSCTCKEKGIGKPAWDYRCPEHGDTGARGGTSPKQHAPDGLQCANVHSFEAVIAERDKARETVRRLTVTVQDVADERDRARNSHAADAAEAHKRGVAEGRAAERADVVAHARTGVGYAAERSRATETAALQTLVIELERGDHIPAAKDGEA